MKAACEPCAKRKVRCDRGEPSCSNCKRRKHDSCAYPDTSPSDKIRRLEDTIRALGRSSPSDRHDPDETEPTASKVGGENTSREKPTEHIAKETPLILREGGSSIYVESWTREGWESWGHGACLRQATAVDSAAHTSRSTIFPEKHLPHAFQGSPWTRSLSTPASSVEKCPIQTQYATKLWSFFMQRVEPVTKVSFEWTLEPLGQALSQPQRWARLSQGERALVLSACLFGVVSLSDEESIRDFEKPRSSFLSECRAHCEDVLCRVELLAIDDISTLKALCLYMRASIDTVTAHSLWSLMGLVSRSAEQLGIHRDGQLLGLSPAETEERRRLWWQLQQLDLTLAFRRGVTPMAFTSHWDAKLPLNIEDCDIAASSKSLPTERRGLTSMSYTLFTYYMVDQQRHHRQKYPRQASASERTVLGPLTSAMIDDIEAGLNKRFLQYCDPIRPLHLLIQISVRALVCVVRLRRLHGMRLGAESQHDEASHDQSFNTALQCLRYCIAGYSQPSLLPFRWLLHSMFAWHALIGVIFDMSHLTSFAKMEESWAVLAELYAVTPFLMNLQGDRRRAHAARSVVATWKACRQKPAFENMEKPAFVSRLEDTVSQLGIGHNDGDATEMDKGSEIITEPPESETWPGGMVTDEPFNFNYADIDWSFWDTIS